MLVDLKKEKGSIFLVNLFKKHLTKYNLSIVGTKKIYP